MASYTYYTAAGQPDFAAPVQTGDYTIEYPLGAAESSALLIKAPFMQVRANYQKPPANSQLTYSPAYANSVLQSENFGATWSATGTPSRVAAATSVNGVLLDLIGDGTGSASNYYTQAITLAANGVQTVSIFVKQGTVPGISQVQLYDNTSASLLLVATINFTAAVPVLAASVGSVISTTYLGNGFYRIAFNSTTATAAHTNTIYVQPSSNAGSAATVYAGGVQVESASSLGPYIATTTTAGTQAAVTGYFVNDDGFRDIRAGVVQWTRTWATIPANHYEPVVYPYQFPAILSAVSPGAITYTTVSQFGLSGAGRMYIQYLAPVGGRVSLSYQISSGPALNSVVVYDNALNGSIVDLDSNFINTTYPRAAGYYPSITAGLRRYVLNAAARAVVSYGYFLATPGSPTFAITPQTKQRFLLGTEEVPFVNNSTVPTGVSYYALVTSFSWFVAEDEQIERYQGNIMQRKVTYVYAQ